MRNADVPESLSNTHEILDKVEFYSIDHDPILPNFPLPEGFNDNDDYLRHLVYEGAKKRWGELDEEHIERIDFELNTIKNIGFPGCSGFCGSILLGNYTNRPD